MILAKNLQPNEVANRLSYREFSTLCGLLDVKGPAGEYITGNNGVDTRLAGKHIELRFKIFKIIRESNVVHVLIYFGEGFGKVNWFKFNTCPQSTS